MREKVRTTEATVKGHEQPESDKDEEEATKIRRRIEKEVLIKR